MNEIEEKFTATKQKQFDTVMEEIQRLQLWFRNEYPESTLRFDVNLKQKQKPELVIKCEVLTGKEMTPDNQGFFRNFLILTEEKWNDIFFMDRLLSGMYNAYKGQISKVMNEHYQIEKERVNGKTI